MEGIDHVDHPNWSQTLKSELRIAAAFSALIGAAAILSACAKTPAVESPEVEVAQDTASKPTINPENWPVVETAPLDPEVEARIDEILAQMTLEQKVGQVIQADSGSVTAEEVKAYRLGSVLSGGNSAPGP